MALSILQHKSSKGSGTGFSLAFTSNVTAGSLLVYMCGDDTGHSLAAATDNNSNTILNAITVTGSGGSGDGRIDYVVSANSGATTVSFHQTSGTEIYGSIWELSGFSAPGAVLDQTGKVASSSTGSVSTSGVTTAANEFAVATFQDSPSADTLTGTASWTVEAQSNAGSGDANLGEAIVLSSTGTQTATVTGNSTHVLSQLIATFKQASSSTTVRKTLSGIGGRVGTRELQGF